MGSCHAVYVSLWGQTLKLSAFRLTGPFPIRIPPYPGCSRSAGIRIDGMPAGRMPSSAAFIRDQVLMTANVDGGQKSNWQRKLWRKGTAAKAPFPFWFVHRPCLHPFTASFLVCQKIKLRKIYKHGSKAQTTEISEGLRMQCVEDLFKFEEQNQ